MKKIFYKYYLKYKGIPHRNHVRDVVGVREPINQMKRHVASLYVSGKEIEKIALEKHIPRERVRQLLISVVR
jgi:hypothetical protein